MLKEPIRILQVIGIMNRGGAETMLMNLYRHMDRTRVQFDFVEHTNEEAAFDKEIDELGGMIYHCPSFKGINYFEYKKWWDNFFNKKRGRYKIIHGHIGSTAAIYLSSAKKKGLYTIAHSHCAGEVKNVHQFLYWMISYPTRNIADYFFACSQEAGYSRFGEKVTSKPETYHILNNAIDTRGYEYNECVRYQVRKELGCTKTQLLVGHIGRFSPQKNHVYLIKIFNEILKMGVDARLLMVGDGVLRAEIERLTKDMDVQDSVIFLGVRSDVDRLIQGMDILVFPSLYEGLPVTMVEAQTSGLPCVISDQIPKECIITNDLVSVQRLSSMPKEWAKHIISRVNKERKSHRDEVKARGYNIIETSKWLEEFYLERYE